MFASSFNLTEVVVIAFVVLLGVWQALESFASPDRKRLTRLEAKIDLVLKNLGLSYDPLANAPADVLEAIRSGQKIEAIKLYRAATGADLAEAKEYVEELQARLQP